jgi:hypothetical protein
MWKFLGIYWRDNGFLEFSMFPDDLWGLLNSWRFLSVSLRGLEANIPSDIQLPTTHAPSISHSRKKCHLSTLSSLISLIQG